MAPNAALETLATLWSVLQREKIEAALAGGLALATWKHPRTTRDVDVLIAIELEDIQTLKQTLANANFRSKDGPTIDFEQTQLVQFTFEPSSISIDVQVDLLVAKSQFASDAIGRSVHLNAEALGFDIRVLSCEDLILFKLLAGRIIDLADAAELLRVNSKTIDNQQLDRTAASLGVVEPLELARNEALR